MHDPCTVGSAPVAMAARASRESSTHASMLSLPSSEPQPPLQRSLPLCLYTTMERNVPLYVSHIIKDLHRRAVHSCRYPKTRVVAYDQDAYVCCCVCLLQQKSTDGASSKPLWTMRVLRFAIDLAGSCRPSRRYSREACMHRSGYMYHSTHLWLDRGFPRGALRCSMCACVCECSLACSLIDLWYSARKRAAQCMH